MNGDESIRFPCRVHWLQSNILRMEATVHLYLKAMMRNEGFSGTEVWLQMWRDCDILVWKKQRFQQRSGWNKVVQVFLLHCIWKKIAQRAIDYLT